MYAVAFILVPREQVSAGNLVRRIFLGSVKPYPLLAGGQQINVLRRRVQNASFHGAAPRAIAVVVTTASRSRRRYLISPDLEAAERIGPERRGYGDVDRIAAPCHQHSPDPRHVVARVEGIPASSEIRLEPSGEIWRAVGWRCTHVAEIAGAVPRRNVHASAEGNSKMCVIAADPAPLVERFPGCSCRAGMLIAK